VLEEVVLHFGAEVLSADRPLRGTDAASWMSERVMADVAALMKPLRHAVPMTRRCWATYGRSVVKTASAELAATLDAHAKVAEDVYEDA
jgi:hypothetical protein